MIIVGAKGFAKEILQVAYTDLGLTDDKIVFFDDISTDLPEKLYNRFLVLKTLEGVKEYMQSTGDKEFVLGIGNPVHRKALYDKFVGVGAIPVTTISKKAEKGDFDVSIGTGTNVMSGTIITNSVVIGKGCLINLNCTVAHDCIIGDFVEVSPNVNISGRCKIGSNSSIGTNAILIPDVIIGENVIVGAGTLVLKDVPNNCTIVGVPGKIIKR